MCRGCPYPRGQTHRALGGISGTGPACYFSSTCASALDCRAAMRAARRFSLLAWRRFRSRARIQLAQRRATVGCRESGGPVAGENICKRILAPLLKRLGIPKAGLHAFRHGRVTVLRKRGIPPDLQLQWIGHSSLRTTDRYSHTDQELEYRRAAAASAGLNLVIGPNGPNAGAVAG